MDTYMPNLGGAQALASVRWQPNGKAVPVIFMIDKRYPVSIESLQGAYVYGMINKPLTAGGLVAAVDSFFVREARENQNRGNRG